MAGLMDLSAYSGNWAEAEVVNVALATEIKRLKQQPG
jgi:hypothetical protein